MIELPQCRHRGAQIGPHNWVCHSTAVEVLGGIATSEMCRDHCPLVDHEPVHADAEAFSGRFPAISPLEVDLRPELVSIGVLTAPRPVSTFERSLAELRRGGFTQTIQVFAEPGCRVESDPGLCVHQGSEKLGAWKNWRRAAETMLRNTSSEFILLCEDDIGLCPCAACALQVAIDRFPRASWGFASLYTPAQSVWDSDREEGWIEVCQSNMWGSLAWCFSRQSLRSVLSSRPVSRNTSDRDTDLVVSAAIRSLGLKSYFHVPSLATHIGAGISSLGHIPLGASEAVWFDANYSRYVRRATAVAASRVSTGQRTLLGTPADSTISVVIPNYNCGDFLNACIRSFQNQTVPCEIVVVDDGSSDNSLEVLSQFGGGIRVLRHDDNRGANQARITGVLQSQSTWVVLADADAVYASNYLEKLLAQTDDSVSVAYCSLRCNFGEDRREVIRAQPYNRETLWWYNYMSMCSLVRRTVLPIESMSSANFFDDWALWMQLASKGHVFRAVDEVLFEALVRPNGLSAQILGNAHRRAVELASLRRAHATLIGCDAPVSVVIPATDCPDLTVECLWHLARYSGIPLRVVYVDNGSRSETPARIAEYAQLFELPIKIIRNATNRGFTRAVNQGIRESDSSHVLCLNNDCFVGPQCVDRLYWQLTRGGRRVAAVGPLTGDQSDQSLRRPARRAQAGVDLETRFDYWDAVPGARMVTGDQRGRNEERLAFFCTLLHRRALEECGLLDEKTKEFQSGLGADDEWCLRARKHGWQVRLALDAFAAHLESQTFRKLNMDRSALQRQALKRLQTKQ